MISVVYTKTFLKKFSRLDQNLQEEIYEKVELFRDEENHSKLKVHKLRKPFVEVFSFSVNYKIRILFSYLKEGEVALLTVGNHDHVYRR